MIPVLYEPTATSFDTNGLGSLSDAIECIVEEERNGAYTLTLTYPVDGLHYEDITLSSLIKVFCGEGRGEQVFRVYKITRPMSGRVSIMAQHLSYQLSMIPTMPFSASSANAALAGLKSNAAEACPFTFWTDKATVANYAQTLPESIRSRLGGVQGSILDVYGGEFEFDNYTVRLWANRGTDRGVTLRYGKNIVDLTQEQNIENTITGVVPYWSNDAATVTLPEKVVSASSASSYPFPRTIPLDCSPAFEEQPTVADLRAYAQTYVAQAGIGVPKVAINVSFVNLRDTEEYADVAALERVELCDYVTVIYDKLGVDTRAQVVKTSWDVLAERYKSIDIGDVRTSLAQTIATTVTEAAEAVTPSALQSAVQKATDLITGVTGGYIKFNRNANGQPYEMLIMDEATEEASTNIWRYNSAGWGFSHDGGANYTTAATLDGGIIADSIVAGTLTGLAINNGNGTFKVDSSGSMTASNATITNGVLNNGSGTFKVDANGNLTANSLNSSNATITGGKINIQTSSDTADYITLNSSKASTSIQTSGLYVTNKATAGAPNRRAQINGAGIFLTDTSTNTVLIQMDTTGNGAGLRVGSTSGPYVSVGTAGVFVYAAGPVYKAGISVSDGTVHAQKFTTVNSGNLATGRTATLTISGTTLKFVNGLLVN